MQMRSLVRYQATLNGVVLQSFHPALVPLTDAKDEHITNGVQRVDGQMLAHGLDPEGRRDLHAPPAARRQPPYGSR